VETIPKGRNKVWTLIYKNNLKGNSHVIAPADMTVREAQDEEITQLREVEHIRL